MGKSQVEHEYTALLSRVEWPKQCDTALKATEEDINLEAEDRSRDEPERF